MLVHALLFHDVVVAILGEGRGAPRKERAPPSAANAAPVILSDLSSEASAKEEAKDLLSLNSEGRFFVAPLLRMTRSL
jgi:hypothetical protein